jgi:HSP20 family protein
VRSYQSTWEITPEAWNPPFEVTNDNEKLVLKVELPDCKPEDIDITVNEGLITFKGKKQQQRQVERKDYYWTEASTSSFSRSIPLPKTAQWQKAEATFDRGVLEVVIPRIKPEKPRQIKIHKSE